MARAHTVEAIEALVAALKRPKEAVPAAVALLNRGWGLPTQPVVDETPSGSLSMMHLVAARRVGLALQAEWVAGRSPVAVDERGSPTIDYSVPAPE